MTINTLYRVLERRFDPLVNRLTRREMLRETLAGAAGLLLSASVSAQTRGAAGKRVVVVGAGFGGLSAAFELATVGYDVTVVEARKRLGGKVVSFLDLVPGKFVEGGGELIGANHPTWTAYAERFGLKFIDVVQDQFDAPIVLEGRRLTRDESRVLWKEMRSGVVSINADAATVNADEPWTHPEAVRLDRRATSEWIAGLDVAPQTKRVMAIQLTAINGVVPAWQSYLANLAMIKGGGLEKYWTQTDLFHCAGGCQQLAQKLAAGLKPERLILGIPATSVTLGERGAVTTLADGRRLESDDVILAVPTSCWNRIAFDPPFPPELRLQMGSNVKFLAALRDRFWKRTGNSARVLTDGPINMGWESTENQPGDEGAGLTMFSGGPSVDRVAEWGESERVNHYLKALEELYPEIGKHFVASRFMNWPADPWSKGSYSFPAPGQVTMSGPLIRKGLGSLHFTGEYASPAFVGYMEGALNSGVALAKRLASRDGMKN